MKKYLNNVIVVLMFLVSKVLIENRIIKVDIFNFRPVCWLVVHSSIGKWSSCKLFELHDITSQCTCLIGENVLDLPQFFIKVRRVYTCWHVLCNIIHVRIIGYEHGLQKLH